MTLFGSLPCGTLRGRKLSGAGDASAGGETLHSGPFTLRRYAQGHTSALSSRGCVLLFCLRGSVELRLHSFSYRLTPRCVAAVDGRQLAECRCGADTELLEYRPRAGWSVFRSDGEGHPAFTVLPSRLRLNAWAATVSLRLREGVVFDRDSSCAVRVQLRDLSGGCTPLSVRVRRGVPPVEPMCRGGRLRGVVPGEGRGGVRSSAASGRAGHDGRGRRCRHRYLEWTAALWYMDRTDVDFRLAISR